MFSKDIELPVTSDETDEGDGSVRNIKVYVTGYVRNPGVYRLRSETSVAQIIPMAGGFTDWANQRKILVIRNEDGREKRITVNYKKIIGGNDPDSNVILKPGDTIVVP
jgi:polysaccharide export outer membrane protein